jgi:DNA-binding PadR family transcriptional regulator
MSSASPAGEAAKLAVLGVLSAGPNHGYGVRAVLEGWEVHRWLDIKYGSIYAALHRFESSGLVRVVGTDAERGPTRTTYELTDTGRDELRAIARRSWSQTPKWSMPIDLAMTFLSFDWVGSAILGRDEVVALLDERIGALDATIEFLTQTKQTTMDWSELKPLRALQAAHFDHGIELLRTERRWTKSVLEALQAGDYDLS